MVVQCEGCGTKFSLADAQVPKTGVLVRCSKCHARFVVRPASAAAEDTPEAEEIAENSPIIPAPEAPEPDLDNPEFLFDAPSPDENEDEDEWGGAQLASSSDEVLGFADEPEPQPEPASEPAPIRASAEPAAAEEADAVFGAGDDFFGDDASVEAGGDSDPAMGDILGSDEELAAMVADAISPDDLDLSGITPDDSGPDLSADLRDIARAGPVELGEAPDTPVAEVEGPEISADLDDDPMAGADWGDDDSWEPVMPGDSAAEVVASPTDEDEASGADSARQPPRPRAPQPPNETEPGARARPSLDSMLWIGAIAAGVLLAFGGLRALGDRAIGPEAGPEVVALGSWTARQIEAHSGIDAAGRRVLSVTGRLEAAAAAGGPPQLIAVLYDASGERVGDPTRARLEPATGTPTGFSFAIAEPPLRAERFGILVDSGS